MICRSLILSVAVILLQSALNLAAPNVEILYARTNRGRIVKRANEFLDKCFDENVARHPQFASSLGLKTDYDKWDDLSDAANAADLAFALQNLATLKRDFNFDSLDPQTQLSWRLFEADIQQNAEGFRFRQNNFPVNQMFGWHSQTPTFLINIHRIDSVSDAEAYIARLNGVATGGSLLRESADARPERDRAAEICLSAGARCLP